MLKSKYTICDAKKEKRLENENELLCMIVEDKSIYILTFES